MKNISIYMKQKSRYLTGTLSVKVTGPTDVKSNETYTGFKCYEHRFTCEGIDTLMLKIYNSDRKDGSVKNLIRRIIDITMNGIVYVYFYQEDPRPLLVCYNKQVYIPNDKGNYDKVWVKETSIQKCVCEATGQCDNCDKLLEQLVKVVGFLNRVDLSKHPTGTGNGTCSGNSASRSDSSTCTATDGQGTGNSCTYVVHKYNTKKVEVKVTCESVPRNGTDGSRNGCNYKKLIHEPIGTNGAGAKAAGDNGFRLGNVVYKNKSTGKLGYTKGGNKRDHWCKPLIRVTAYFYEADKEYQDPLLVVLEFKNNGVGMGNAYEYYKLTCRDDKSMKWQKDESASCQMRYTTFKYLDGIRYKLKKVLKVEISCRGGTYAAMGRDGKPVGSGKHEFTPLNGEGKNVEVEDCTAKCAQLASNNYKCVVHKIKDAISTIPNQVAGVAFTIPGQDERGRKSDKVIQLYNDTDEGVESMCETGEKGKNGQITPLTYNSCMGDICVYFYDRDPRPLMFCYNGNFYAPRCKDEYYSKWVKVKVCDIKKCDCTASDSDGCSKLLEELVKVSDFLNPLNIRKIPRGNCTFSCYTIHWFGGCRIRMKVKQTTTAKDGFCYNGYTHTHLGIGCNGEGFRLGKIRYGGKCIEKNGTGGTNGCITSVLDNGRGPKTYKSADKVVVFYYQGDKQLERPLLVALCKKGNGSNGVGTCIYQPYYELQKDDRVGSTVKRYTKVESSIDLSETSGSELEKKLDNIRYNIAITLQIIIDKRPLAKLYCPPKKGETKPKNGGNQNSEKPFPCEDKGPDETKHSIKAPSYEAQLYYKDGKQVKNWPPPPPAITNFFEFVVWLVRGIAALAYIAPKTTSIHVTEIKCWQLSRHGYRCYEHQITGVTGVDQIGGLKFYLWDNTVKGASGSAGAGCTSGPGAAGRSGTECGKGTSGTCRELCLYKECSPDSAAKDASNSCPAASVANSNSAAQTSCDNSGTPSQLSLVNTTYTTCKGNVYVYFYGEDPRPLMLCYDGNAYGPRCKEDYESKWVCVPGVKGCGVKEGKTVCTVPASEQILKALYGASMFLNPVKLGLTRCALKAQDKKPYKYPIHQFNTTCVKVSVSPTDLSCYRQYVHRPEKEGFRLGEVSYDTSCEKGKCSGGDKCNSKTKSPQCPQAPVAQESNCTPTSAPSTSGTTQPFCFTYCQSKQLIGVSLYYYMYDCSHQYPLIIELQFVNKVSEYYRLVCKEAKEWVKMSDPNEKNSGKKNNCKNGELSCDKNQAGTNNCTQSTQDATTDICELDAEFARNAKRIEQQILGLHMASEVDQVEFMALTAELLLLIEHRAYQIRTGLGLKWNRDKANLIIKTDKNCHEDSMLMYLVGGGTFYNLFTHYTSFILFISKISSITLINS